MKNHAYKEVRPAGRQFPLWRTLATIVVVGALLSGGPQVYRQYKQDTATQITIAQTAVKTLEASDDESKRFDEQLFAFDLPADWKKTSGASTSKFTYQSTKTNADNRFLTIYADELPRELPVNKALAVHPEGAGLAIGTASDNCTTFTSAAGGQGALVSAAKWDGVDFLCDRDRKFRNVIGTSSPGNINSVSLTGQTAGTHRFFFTYEDNNNNPDNAIFYRMLKSFTVK